MSKHIFFLLLSLLMFFLFSGCSGQSITENIKNNGFEIIYDSDIIDKNIQDWVMSKKSSAGIHENKFPTGNYLLLSFGNQTNYVVKEIDVEKDNSGYLFNVTVYQPNIEVINNENILASPILVRTKYPNENYSIKIIYQ